MKQINYLVLLTISLVICSMIVSAAYNPNIAWHPLDQITEDDTGAKGVTDTLIVKNGKVGIGTQNPDSLLNVEGEFIGLHPDSGVPVSVKNIMRPSISGKYNSAGIWSAVFSAIPLGVTNEGYLMALHTISLRDNTKVDSDKGTLERLYGQRIAYGHANTDNGVTTNNAYGLMIDPYLEGGVVTKAYDIYLATKTGDVGAAEHFSLYQQDPDTKNYFAGKVGIGTINPQDLLHVSGGSGIAITNHVTPGNRYVIIPQSGNSGLDIGYKLDGLQSWYTNNPALTILYTGNVGIGTTTPDAKLQVSENEVSSGEHLVGLFGRSDGSVALGYQADGTNELYGIIRSRHNVDLGLGAGSGTHLFIKQDGNVGIGTTTPTEKLDVVGNIKATGQICAGEECIGSGSLSALSNNGGVWTQTDNDVYYNDGDVGIGTSDPLANLEIENRADGFADINLDGSAGGILRFLKNGVNKWGIITENAGAGKIGFYDYNAVGYKMVIDSLGNVGVGTSDPQANLEIENRADGFADINLDGSAGGILRFLKGGVNRWGIITENADVGTIGFYDYNAVDYKMVIDGSGNVGIGTRSPGAKLDVQGGRIRGQYEGQINFASVTTGNWYRIAQNSGNRANAEFTLRDYISGGGHSTLTFRAGVSYNYANGISFTVLNHNYYSSPTFTKVRILEKDTYDPQYLEVYVERSGSVDYSIYDNLQSSGWEPVDWTTGSIPSGYSAREYDVNNLFMVGDYDDRFTVKRGGDVKIAGNLEVTGSITGTGGAGMGLDRSKFYTIVAAHSDTNGAVDYYKFPSFREERLWEETCAYTCYRNNMLFFGRYDSEEYTPMSKYSKPVLQEVRLCKCYADQGTSFPSCDNKWKVSKRWDYVKTWETATEPFSNSLSGNLGTGGERWYSAYVYSNSDQSIPISMSGVNDHFAIVVHQLDVGKTSNLLLKFNSIRTGTIELGKGWNSVKVYCIDTNSGGGCNFNSGYFGASGKGIDKYIVKGDSRGFCQ